MSPWWKLALIIFGTFVSEDLTCVTVGMLINRFQLDWFLGLLGCFLGIFIGDIGLWCTGRIAGRAALRWRFVARRLEAHRIEQMAQWFNRNSWWVVFASRFVPGTRLPLYVGAGTLGVKASRFIFWAFLSDMVWTPLLVLTVAFLGDIAARPFEWLLGPGSLLLVGAVAGIFLLVRLIVVALSPFGRLRLWVAASRLWRWEFWPAWLFYAGLVPYLVYLVLRHRSLTVWTAANPAIPQGGVVGESKFDILRQLPQQWVVPSARIESAEVLLRTQRLQSVMEQQGWNFPLVLKPDAGERGFAVKRVPDLDDAETYLQAQPQPVLAQVYHPGPYEAGIFYFRFPDQPQGHILSITDNHFPHVVGDGHSTLERLIWNDTRLRMQVGVFRSRHAQHLKRIVAKGQQWPLVVAGNYCQGALFKDGTHLQTVALERAIDEIARKFDGFYFGRFDVRYADTERLRWGEGFAIIELNGASSESTNIYDPSWSLASAYRTLCRQWSILFRIGSCNRARGHRRTSPGTLVRIIFKHYAHRRGTLISD